MWKVYIGIALFVGFSLSCQRPADSKTTGEPEEVFDLSVDEMRVRDPFIFVDRKAKCYYMNANAGDNKTLICYKSKDLTHWREVSHAFTADSLFWGKRDFWAPDMFCYKGKYYILATFSNEHCKRGTSFLVSETPEGPYRPLSNQPITPADWTCLDATLYIDEAQKPWLLYSREWLEVGDGQILIQPLAEDLTSTAGEPILLFTASQASWTAPVSAEGVTGYVTDAPFLYRNDKGELLMIWSSFTKKHKYAIGVARSDNGKLTGVWTPDPQPINDDCGGHAMIFKDLNGKLMISYHAPNDFPERPTILPLVEVDDNLQIGK